jgi:hypothetical protein
MLKDGYQCAITFSNATGIALWEKTLTPPGIDGGAKVDNTTQHNQGVRTAYPRGLYDTADSKMTVAYDPAVLVTVLAQVNKNQEITLNFPDGSTWTFWGWLGSFIPGPMEEGTQPTAECTIFSGNIDDTGPSDVETAPTYGSGA